MKKKGNFMILLKSEKKKIYFIVIFLIWIVISNEWCHIKSIKKNENVIMLIFFFFFKKSGSKKKGKMVCQRDHHWSKNVGAQLLQNVMKVATCSCG